MVESSGNDETVYAAKKINLENKIALISQTNEKKKKKRGRPFKNNDQLVNKTGSLNKKNHKKIRKLNSLDLVLPEAIHTDQST